MALAPKKSTGYNNASDKIISQDDWARTEGDGVIIEGINDERLYIWLTGGLLPEGRKEPMSVDARALYALLATYFGHLDYDPGADGEHLEDGEPR